MMYASDPHESESENEREEHDPDSQMRMNIMKRTSIGEMVVENGEIRFVRGNDGEDDNEEDTSETGSESSSNGSSTTNKEPTMVETAGGMTVLPIRTTRVPIYSDPMVQEAAERRKRQDLELQKALEAQLEAVGGTGASFPTTSSSSRTSMKGVVSALQDKYEQMVSQYKYDGGTKHDSDAARYGYRFGVHSSNTAGKENTPTPTKRAPYDGNHSASGGRKRKPWSAEESNKWLLQIIWMGLTMTLIMMMIMSASNSGRDMLRASIATNSNTTNATTLPSAAHVDSPQHRVHDYDKDLLKNTVAPESEKEEEHHVKNDFDKDLLPEEEKEKEERLPKDGETKDQKAPSKDDDPKNEKEAQDEEEDEEDSSDDDDDDDEEEEDDEEEDEEQASDDEDEEEEATHTQDKAEDDPEASEDESKEKDDPEPPKDAEFDEIEEELDSLDGEINDELEKENGSSKTSTKDMEEDLEKIGHELNSLTANIQGDYKELKAKTTQAEEDVFRARIDEKEKEAAAKKEGGDDGESKEKDDNPTSAGERDGEDVGSSNESDSSDSADSDSDEDDDDIVYILTDDGAIVEQDFTSGEDKS